MKSIALVGFMGSGKSHIGKLLSDNIGFQFIDLDAMIEKEFGSITQIFRDNGEEYFRKVETDMLKRALSMGDTVISTGGGVPVIARNIKELKNKAVTFFIDTPFNICYNRIKSDDHRPLVRKKNEEAVKQIFDERYLKYIAASDYLINGNKNDKEIVAEISGIYLNEKDYSN